MESIYYLSKFGEIYAKIDKMKAKLLAYTLVKALGITTKKIMYSLNNIRTIENITKLNNIKTDTCLINLMDIASEKEKNVM